MTRGCGRQAKRRCHGQSFRFFICGLCLLFSLVARHHAAAGEATAMEILSPGRFTHKSGADATHRAPVKFNDDHDTGLYFKARRFWRCIDNCPAEGCDHRTHEPVWDYLYVGGRVEREDDLLEVELAATSGKPPRDGAVLEIVEGGENIRLWPDRRKGRKRDILSGPVVRVANIDIPRRLFVEGIKPGTALLRLRWNDGGGDQTFSLYIDVLALEIRQGGSQRFIYNAGDITLSLEPESLLRTPAYFGRIAWSGDASGRQSRVVLPFDPGDKAVMRRAVYAPKVTVNDALVFERKIRVRQKVYTGTPVARTTPERRREVESLLAVPDIPLMKTELPDSASKWYTQAWFEAYYTGSEGPNDPVKPINESRLQYAPRITRERNLWGVAFQYLTPYGVFISPQAYEDGLKREDLAAVAHHELRHLTHFSTMYAATGFWHVLCRHLEYKIATYFMEADASSASLHSDCSWRYMHKCGNDMTRNYRLAEAEIAKLPSLPQIESAVTVLQDVYKDIPPDMDEFKRQGFECHIRPPLEVDEIPRR